MKSIVLGALIAAGLLVTVPAAQQAPAAAAAPAVQAQPAKQLLDAALAKARADKKNVFVHFSASWCGWCHKLEAVIVAPEGKMLTDYAVDLQLVVLESKGKEMLENPGAADMMKNWGGTGGIPFYVFLDGQGNVLADANGMPNKGNIGYPANPQEIQAFDGVLIKGLPKMPADVRAKLLAYIAARP